MAKKRVPKKSFNPLELVSGLNEDVKLSIDSEDELLDLSEEENKVTLKADVSSLIDSKDYPASFRVDAYEIGDTGEKVFVSASVVTVLNSRKAKNAYFEVTLGAFDTVTKELFFDLFDYNGDIVNSYKATVSVSDESFLSSMANLDDASCVGVFNECHLKYFFDKVNFLVSPSTYTGTSVYRETNGTFTVNLPLLSKKKFKIGGGSNKSSDSSSSTPGNNNNNNNSNLNTADNVLIGGKENNVKLSYGEDSQKLDYIFGSSTLFTFTKQGALGIGVLSPSARLHIRGGDGETAAIILDKGSLLSNKVDGAMEYDGSKLYFTVGSTREEIALGAAATGSQGPTGPQGPAGPAGSFSGGDASITGTLTFSGAGKVQAMVANGHTTFNDLVVFDGEVSNSGAGATTINWNSGNKQNVTLTANSTLTFTNPTAGVTTLVLRVIQDATGSRTITWPGSVDWPGGTAPTLTTAANSVDIVSCYYVSPNYYCKSGLDFK